MTLPKTTIVGGPEAPTKGHGQESESPGPKARTVKGGVGKNNENFRRNAGAGQQEHFQDANPKPWLCDRTGSGGIEPEPAEPNRVGTEPAEPRRRFRPREPELAGTGTDWNRLMFEVKPA